MSKIKNNLKLYKNPSKQEIKKLIEREVSEINEITKNLQNENMNMESFEEYRDSKCFFKKVFWFFLVSSYILSIFSICCYLTRHEPKNFTTNRNGEVTSIYVQKR